MQIDLFLIIFVASTRIMELVISKKNTYKLLKQGAIEYHSFHYRFIVIFHLIFIFYFLRKSFYFEDINNQLVLLFFIVQILRYKILFDLGRYWTTRIIVLKNKPLVNKGFYKHIRHPNYVIVFLEVIIISLAFKDLIALAIFTFFNTVLISIRIFYENKANANRRNLF